MTKIERYVISRLIIRYLGKIEKEELMLDHILPMVEKFTSKNTPTVLRAISQLLDDWKNEVQEYERRRK